MAGQDDTTRNNVGPILGLLGAVGLAIAFVALRGSTRRHGDDTRDKRKALATYLRDHLAGADTAILMVQGLRDAYRTDSEGALFASLYEQFREDRGVVEGMLVELGYTSGSAKRLAGRATGSALRVVAGGTRGDLSLFRTLEALAIGVQGKRCLWRAAQALIGLPHPPGRRSFVELEADAVRQWESIEQSVSGRASSSIAARSSPIRSASDARLGKSGRGARPPQPTSHEVHVEWFRDRALTLVLMAMFLLFLAAQMVTGLYEYNATQREHGEPRVSMSGYLATGHPWEAVFENWESEFLQMAVFVLLTTWLVQKGSPESRRPGAKELVDTDPRDFADDPEAPWPVRRGGWILRLYEHSLGLAFILLFLLAWVGHALGGFSDYAADEVLHHQPPPTFTDYVTSSRFWFESFQNWQSEFLAMASMVWLAVYLRQRWSPESKPVHAPHAETGR